jgi:hypothetical protein
MISSHSCCALWIWCGAPMSVIWWLAVSTYHARAAPVRKWSCLMTANGTPRVATAEPNSQAKASRPQQNAAREDKSPHTAKPTHTHQLHCTCL